MSEPIKIPTIEPPEILKNPLLWNRITIDEFNKKIVGEYDTRNAIFLSLCGIWVKNRKGMLNLCVNSESSAGKSFICQKITQFLPEAYVVYRTKISKEALTYWHNKRFEPEWTWNGKILFLEDVRGDILNSDALKVMVSEGSTATVVKDQRPIDIEIIGKPLILVTTRDASSKTEILNRFNLVNMDESKEQTINIIMRQLEDAQKTEDDVGYDEDLQEALTWLKPVRVIVPYANKLLGFVPANDLRMRRGMAVIMDLIRASAAFHQYQREMAGNYVLANEVDYELARRVITKVELMKSPLTYKHKRALKACVKAGGGGWFTANKVMSADPFVSKPSWYTYLSHLVTNGYLISQFMPEDDGIRKVTQFMVVDSILTIDLPTYNSLMNITSFQDVMEAEIL